MFRHGQSRGPRRIGQMPRQSSGGRVAGRIPQDLVLSLGQIRRTVGGNLGVSGLVGDPNETLWAAIQRKEPHVLIPSKDLKHLKKFVSTNFSANAEPGVAKSLITVSSPKKHAQWNMSHALSAFLHDAVEYFQAARENPCPKAGRSFSVARRAQRASPRSHPSEPQWAALAWRHVSPQGVHFFALVWMDRPHSLTMTGWQSSV